MSEINFPVNSNSLPQPINNPQPNKKKVDVKKAAIITASALTAAAIIGVATVRGKNSELPIKKVEFFHGHAWKKGRHPKAITGKVFSVLPNGDKLTLEYVNGTLQKSTREGQNSFVKLYERTSEDKLKVTTIQGDTKKEVIIDDVKEAVQAAKEKFFSIVSSSDELTLEEIQTYRNTGAYLTKQQTQKLDEIIADKQTGRTIDELISRTGYKAETPFGNDRYVRHGLSSVFQSEEQTRTFESLLKFKIAELENVDKRYSDGKISGHDLVSLAGLIDEKSSPLIDELVKLDGIELMKIRELVREYKDKDSTRLQNLIKAYTESDLGQFFGKFIQDYSMSKRLPHLLQAFEISSQSGEKLTPKNLEKLLVYAEPERNKSLQILLSQGYKLQDALSIYPGVTPENIGFIQGFSNFKKMISSLDLTKEVSFADGIVSCEDKALEGALSDFLKVCPDFKSALEEDGAKTALQTLKNLFSSESFEKLTFSQKRALVISSLLNEKSFEAIPVYHDGDKAVYHSLKLSRELDSSLSYEEKELIYKLSDTIEGLKSKRRYKEFQIFSSEDDFKLLKLLQTSTFGASDVETSSLLDKVMERNREIIALSDRNAQLIYPTPFSFERLLVTADSRGDEAAGYCSKFLSTDVTHKSNFEVSDMERVVVLDFTRVGEDEDLAKYGFPRGTKKKDLRFCVNMVGIDFGSSDRKDVVELLSHSLQDSLACDRLWSKTFISLENQETFYGRKYGFVTAPKIGHMHSTYVDGRRTGYSKSVSKNLHDILTNSKNKDRLEFLPSLVRESLGLNEEEYVELVKILKKQGNIFEEANNGKSFKIGGKEITIDSLREAVKASQDRLFETVQTSGNSKNNEIIDEGCDILALIVKGSQSEYGYSHDYFFDVDTDFIHKFREITGRDIPVFVI